MIDSTKVQDFTCNGKCSGCGNCCTDFLPMSKSDVKRIKTYLKSHPEIKEQIHIDGDNMHIKCAFRDEVNKKCLIYPARPFVCKQFICSLDSDTVLSNRDKIQSTAYYNKINPTTKEMSNMISSHALFFDNFNWELSFVYNTCQFDEAKVKEVLKHFHIQYKFEEEE
jgi:Fe-S-cluster containining protein